MLTMVNWVFNQVLSVRPFWWASSPLIPTNLSLSPFFGGDSFFYGIL